MMAVSLNSFTVVKVYVDDQDGTIFDASLNQSMVANNNNKVRIMRSIHGDD